MAALPQWLRRDDSAVPTARCPGLTRSWGCQLDCSKAAVNWELAMGSEQSERIKRGPTSVPACGRQHWEPQPQASVSIAGPADEKVVAPT
ncbi:unnamed protein product [Lampetra fluviatilis]